MTKAWIVTGGGRGLGRAIVETVLDAGHHVLATARDCSLLETLAAEHHGRLIPFLLDVTDEAGAQRATDEAMRQFGQIDVLVNNAGYGHFQAFEQKSSESFRAEIETNLFGVVNLTRAVLPRMRVRRSGHIFNISSVGGRVGTPGLSGYQAAKWAVSGFSEVIRSEVTQLGIELVALEPGGMRTGWAETAGNGATGEVLEDYKPSVGQMIDQVRSYAGAEVGDAIKIAALILQLSDRRDLPAHLVLGTDAVAVLENAQRQRRYEYERWLPVSQSVVFQAPKGALEVALGLLDQRTEGVV